MQILNKNRYLLRNLNSQILQTFYMGCVICLVFIEKYNIMVHKNVYAYSAVTYSHYK